MSLEIVHNLGLQTWTDYVYDQAELPFILNDGAITEIKRRLFRRMTERICQKEFRNAKSFIAGYEDGISHIVQIKILPESKKRTIKDGDYYLGWASAKQDLMSLAYKPAEKPQPRILKEENEWNRPH